MEIFANIGGAILTFFAGLWVPLSNFVTESSPAPTPVIIEESESIEINVNPPVSTTVIGHGSITKWNNTVNFDLKIPTKGGEVTGSANGFCSGDIKGAYDNNTGFIHGKLDGWCAIIIPASGNFEGKFDLLNKTGLGTFEGTGGGVKVNEKWNLVLSN